MKRKCKILVKKYKNGRLVIMTATNPDGTKTIPPRGFKFVEAVEEDGQNWQLEFDPSLETKPLE